MTTRALSTLVMCACASSSPTPIRNTEPQESAHLARIADDALAAILRPDYRRPFDPRELHYAPVRAKYLAACRAGDRRSCWMVPQLRDPEQPARDASADDFIAHNCMAGDVMSCRGLSSDDDRPGLPGVAIRTAACRDDLHCDLAVLHDDCARGFPIACLLSSGLTAGSRSTVEQERFIALAVDGCAHGLLDDCESIRRFAKSDRWRDAQIVAATRLCSITGEHCSDAILELGTSVAARDIMEHQCQITPTPLRRRIACSDLIKSYAAHAFPEPVANRFVDLRDWYCREPVGAPMPEICAAANLTRPIAGE
jgi:hypothetical protein